MSTHGKLIAPNSLQFERLLPGPKERVWEYITDGDKRGQWFAGGSTNLEVGGEIKYVFNNSHLSSQYEPAPDKYKDYGDGFVSHAKVIKSEPHDLFVIEWEGLVTFELQQQGEEVKLTLTHEKLNDSKETRVGTLAGWHTHLDILHDLLNDKKCEGFWSVHMEWEGHYAKVVD
ncbi:Uncharacterized conserved protein YndB, AHSA1/START domain [Ekhidna lutea]|uniref:Uncharacterized conserved protein YndB, AHSA1/START domain n=1 Tax=Ekhidna lutea TaxID=447679 RepID=A0A239GNX5_EKHLU|nr:SRPBCC family protein [Ekhidna lutea]SNS70830.1 Uncharacterized conserved protein YndB, AHSA1/START domain [Ekhidna lutea]